MKKLLYLTFALSLAFVLAVLVLKWGSNAKLYRETSAVVEDTYPVIVIDAGHGGEDGGAQAADGTLESELNLAVALRFRALCELFGLRYSMTRESAEIVYPSEAQTVRERKTADQRARARLLAETENAVLFSIHQNLYPAASPHGAQTLYAASAGSKELAETLQALLLDQVDKAGSRGAVEAGGEIYLLKTAACPAILLECGFLSNPEELALLKTDVYQCKLALALVSAYFQTFVSGEESYG